MSWKRHYSPELQQRRDKRREARGALAALKEQEARDALGVKTPPPLKPGAMIRRARAGTGREMIAVDIYRGMLSEVNKALPEAKRLRGNNAPIIRRYTYGTSKYDPKTEDRKHAEAAAGGRLQLAGRVIRRLHDRLIGKARSPVQPDLPGLVGA